MKYYWLHFKTCNHGDSWPCVQPKGYASCGTNGWTIGKKGKGRYPYQVIGSDDIFKAKEFDKIVLLENV